jgi:capsular exopolysaccharide synthesis family protein
MGKTFEALERAEKEYGDKTLELSIGSARRRRERGHAAKNCYEVLKTNILARHPGHLIKTILFSGTTHGDGSSTTSINFATTLACNCRLEVLLIEANMRTPSLHRAFNVETEHGLSDLLTNGNESALCIKKVDPGNLSVVTAGSRLTDPVTLFESKRFFDFLIAEREKYDYVILDGPSVPGSSDVRVICNKVDGVVLVLEAGKTRKQVAVRAKQELEEAGGKLLGVVLNKRKFYIPEWIYKRL